ncbi:hypothetical protein [Nocardia paucivorans]|uniref:hypothetical protein n=1 Tax=Nocardia paucivorans TaxID=114259 RepID=UPI0002EDBFC0|nr:hypothetical protein [Nocardia paucivorans]
MFENTGPEETEAEQTLVVWPEPSRLDSWWQRIMTGSDTGTEYRPTAQVPPG